jgi:uncharacterized protein with ParB-like and HNH nuclease domain
VSPQVEVEDSVSEDSEQIPYVYSITSYGADMMVDGIVKRITDNSIITPPFQRGFVWDIEKSSRFIESLLLGLPVPGIFLSRHPKTSQLMVIDGQQRLKTLYYYFKGYFINESHPFKLKGLTSDYNNLAYSELSPEDKRRLDDSIIHATIVKQDEPTEDNSSIYLIFERLNTGGMFLTPQEIRACIYHGKFNELLKSLNENRDWRAIFGKASSRMRDQELILRFFALYYNLENYSPTMKEFLNKYMSHNLDLDKINGDELATLFNKIIELVFTSLGKTAFKPRGNLNAAVFDSVMVALTKRIQKRPIKNITNILTKYNELISNKAFMAFVDAATADAENVKGRIEIASKKFEEVG